MSHELAPGQWLAGKYLIERVLGQGGMGLVLLARHGQLGHQVAIKLIRPDLQVPPQVSARFQREASTAATLTNEHVVRVFDVGVLPGGAPFMVMEYIEGDDLARVLAARGPLPWNEAVGYVIEACVGLAEAHARGIVHRDLKPANLFLTRQSGGAARLKVLDFGIAKTPLFLEDSEALGVSASHALALTNERGLLGSPYYMAPEQFRSPRGVDARADVWALGVILHQLLTGSPAFQGRSVDELLTNMMRGAPSVRAWRPDVPEELAQLILHCLQLDRDRRMPTVGRLAAALSTFVPSHATLAERAARALGEAVPAHSPPPQAQPILTQGAASQWTASPPLQSTSPRPHAPPRTALVLGALLTFGLLGGLAYSIWNSSFMIAVRSAPRHQSLPALASRRVDVLSLYPAARTMARHDIPDARLVGLAATVSSDGLIDLNEGGTLTCAFMSPSKGDAAGRLVSVQVDKSGMVAVLSPANDRLTFAQNEPVCSSATVWHALPSGQPGQLVFGGYANAVDGHGWALYPRSGTAMHVSDATCKAER